MRKTNQQIKNACSKVLKNLSSKKKEVITRRFGLGGRKNETLESIGKDFNVTRERIRQIEKDGFLELEPYVKKCQDIFDYFKEEIEKKGGVRREDLFLSELGKKEVENEIYFLLTLANDFERFAETDDHYAFWAIDEKKVDLAKKRGELVIQKFEKTKKPLKLEELEKPKDLSYEAFASYLEISKRIKNNSEGFWGLKEWPEIYPKTIKDKAYLVFKKTKEPLHFNKVAELIDSALPQTVHNELIKDPRFVLVGRGIYALKEWGYQEGLVKDVILNILKSAGKPLKKEEVLEKILKQRLVKENTVFLNLSNKKYFSRTSEGYYKIREA